jgi:hypothetical protein
VVVQLACLDKAHFITMKDLSASLFIVHAGAVFLDHIFGPYLPEELPGIGIIRGLIGL